MKKEEINLFFLHYCISLDCYGIDVPHENSSTINDTQRIIRQNAHHRLILVGKVEDIQRIKDHIPLKYIHRIITLGDGRTLQIPDEKIISVMTNERGLMIKIISLTMDYIHNEQIQEDIIGNNDEAKARARDILQFTDQVERFYFNH